jgi:hypothetical protein
VLVDLDITTGKLVGFKIVFEALPKVDNFFIVYFTALLLFVVALIRAGVSYHGLFCSFDA